MTAAKYCSRLTRQLSGIFCFIAYVFQEVHRIWQISGVDNDDNLATLPTKR